MEHTRVCLCEGDSPPESPTPRPKETSGVEGGLAAARAPPGRPAHLSVTLVSPQALQAPGVWSCASQVQALSGTQSL